MFPQRREKKALIAPFLMFLFAAAVLVPSASWALDNGQCFDCHGDSGIRGWSKDERASNVKAGGPQRIPLPYPPMPDVSIFVDQALYKASVHADLSCTDCHADIQDLPHTARLKPVDCAGCHGNVVAVYAKSRHALGYDKKPLAKGPRCADCHGAHAIVKTSVSTSPVSRRNVSDTCVRCHGKPELVPNSGIPGAGMMYEKSVHYKAIVEKGLTRAAGCPDCHGAHGVRDRYDAASPVFRPNIPVTCGKCHFGVLTVYRESVHGKAFARNVPDAPSCTDCHGEHEIRQASDPGSSVSFKAVSEKTCPSCHAAEKLSSRYGVAIEKVRGYEQSFHGLAEKLGDRTVANCASCHGTHEIFPSSDPRSTINPKNLAVTCGKCHPGATDNFAKGNIHVGPGGIGGQVKFWVQKIYIWMIVAVIGGMLIHNGADWVRKMQAIYRKRREWAHPGYERLNSNERMQHVLTFTTFIILVITGFALKYKWSIPFVSDAANVWIRGNGHRAAAILMVATCIYHVFYVIFTPRGRDQFIRMLPTIQDARDVVGTLRYFAGFEEHKPKFGRYSYVEKAEDLALVWGSIVMIVTGFLLWFQDEALRHLPMWGLDVATLVHYYEAILATLAIIVWHFYYVFVNPDFAPMAFTWIDGKLSRHEMEHEHALELEEIEEREHHDDASLKGSVREVTTEDS